MYETALAQLDDVAGRLRLDPDLHAFLRVPKRELTVTFPVRTDDGTLRMFTGYRVQHTLAMGPVKGGIRFDEGLSLDVVRALAMWTTWKCALVGLPYGGAHGGVVVNPRNLSTHELERLTRRYACEINILLGPEKDIPEPDFATDEQIMAWIMDAYSADAGYSVPGVVTGKPLSVGGTMGWVDARARGCSQVIAMGMQRFGISAENCRVAFQGFGKSGSIVARILAERGCRVVAASDSGGATWHPDGLELTALAQHKAANGSLEGFPDGRRIDADSVVEVECDVLVAAAKEGQITAANARSIKARLIAEMADSPTTFEADTILSQRGIHLIPDILCNAGGLTVSYFEWVQDNQALFWDEDEIRSRLQQTMDTACNAVFERARAEKCTLRRAALMIAVERIGHAVSMRGIYP
ncbi:MAG: Glu/Leu/Phe/Val dehydrogenase [Armatimonadetes bacterium]|nr:Glu/Leu/Phe/Val dehydrogenase [Armatimonadota bacterium]